MVEINLCVKEALSKVQTKVLKTCIQNEIIVRMYNNKIEFVYSFNEEGQFLSISQLVE